MHEGSWPVDGDIVIEDASHWALAGTHLRNGDHLPGLLGYEIDRMFGNAPPSTQRIGHSPYETEDGLTYGDMTVYTAPSGAIVFATGSIQWNWGLDDYGDGARWRAHPAAQQITRNVLARFAGAQPPAPLSAPAYTLTASPSRVTPGDTITVEWVAPSGRPATDWVGLFQVGDPDTRDRVRQYTGGAPSGKVTFPAPSQPGQYEFRYYLFNTTFKAIDSTTVTVQ